MLALRKVAITGGLSSGKSTVCAFFKELGAYTVSADEIVHNLLIPDSEIGKQLVELFGEDVVQEGAFNQGLIGKQAFANEEKLRALETLLHPPVLEEIEIQFTRAKHLKSHTLFVAEIPLLYEIEQADAFDVVIAVVSKSAIAAKRFREKTSHTEEEFARRMSRQLPLTQKSAKADYTLHNDGTLAELQSAVKDLHNHLNQ